MGGVNDVRTCNHHHVQVMLQCNGDLDTLPSSIYSHGCRKMIATGGGLYIADVEMTMTQ